MSSKQKRTLGYILGASLALAGWHISHSSRVYLVSDLLYFLSMGLLVAGTFGLVSNSGLFDIVVFSGRRVLALIANKPPEEAENQQTFAQYVQREREKYDVRLLLIAGGLCLLASLLASAVSL
ncbi:MAG: DUF3899 domain-containing protein [Bacillota bacterium]|jgi:hypothetical protein